MEDGAHTISAARKAKKKQVQAIVRQGSYLDAFSGAAHANGEHGVRVTNADKRHRVMKALGHEEMSKGSDGKIAGLCGVGRALVQTLRNEQGAFKATSRVGLDGKSYPSKPKQDRFPKSPEERFKEGIRKAANASRGMSIAKRAEIMVKAGLVTQAEADKATVGDEDRQDAEDAAAALKDIAENGTIPWEKVKADAGIEARAEGDDDAPDPEIEEFYENAERVYFPQHKARLAREERLKNRTWQERWHAVKGEIAAIFESCPDDSKTEFADELRDVARDVYLACPGVTGGSHISLE